MKRVELSYIPLASIADAINGIAGTELEGSDIFQYLTEVAGITYDTDQQGVISHVGFVIGELAELTAEDIDRYYHYGNDNDPDNMQWIVDAIAELHRDICEPNGARHEEYWNTCVIDENGGE